MSGTCWTIVLGGENLKRLFLLAVLVAMGGAYVPPGAAQAKPERIDMKHALKIALDALKDRPERWTGGCDIRVRRGEDDWALYFEPSPMGPGLDVMVIVHADGSTTIGPGY
jgi:hypothetical protein